MHRQESGTPYVTPTFAAVLNKQLAKIMDAIDYGHYDSCYSMIKTLIISLNPTDSKELMANDVAHIDKLILASQRQTSMDSYQSKRNYYQKKEEVLRRNLRSLLWKVMQTLHNGGYLEKQGPQPRATKSGRLKIRE